MARSRNREEHQHSEQQGPLGAQQVMKGGASDQNISEVQGPRPLGIRIRPPGMRKLSQCQKVIEQSLFVFNSPEAQGHHKGTKPPL